MKLFNSLSKNLEEFKPLIDNKVSMYSCGPTVYDNLHIGNLSAFIYADLLRRTLTTVGYSVHHVMNVTDIDDKTIRSSKVEFPDDEPQTALSKIGKKYTDVFLKDLRKTGSDVSQINFISAVDSIADMIVLIQKIIDNGFAYHADDGIYFSIDAYVKAGYDYGILQKVLVNNAKARILNDEYDKDNASDFALWKKAQDGEPFWKADFNINHKNISVSGRPGWHIECSAMSEKLLGIPFDIHTGGIDLKFPHHENEIAQSRGAGASALARYFVHNNHILVDGRKMSKSLKNFYTLRDVEKRGYTGQEFRLLVLESHYKNESNFSWDILEAAQNRLLGYRRMAAHRWQTDESGARMLHGYFEEKQQAIIEALSNDLDTPRALALLNEIEGTINQHMLHPEDVSAFNQFLEFINNAIGIDLLVPDITDEQKDILEQRAKARVKKDWQTVDQLRDQLASKGVVVQDLKNRQFWYPAAQ